MTPIKRSIGAVGAAVLLAATLSACGGAPTDASKKDFCEAFTDEPKDANSDDADKAADAVQEYADGLNEVGTPKDIDGDAREGFEIYVDFLSDIDGEDVKKFEDAEDSKDVFDNGDDAKKVDKFLEKTFEVCADSFGGAE